MGRSRALEPSRRDRLVAAGREAFGRKPYDEVSMSDIAEQVGVAHGLAFHYFESKRGFFIETVRSIGDQMLVVRAIPPDIAPAQAVRLVFNRNIEFFLEHPHTLLTLLRGGLGMDAEIHRVFDETRWDGAMKTLSLIGVSEPTDGTRLLMHGWLSLHDDIVSRWLIDQRGRRNDIVELLVATLISTLSSVTLLEPDTKLDLDVLRLPS